MITQVREKVVKFYKNVKREEALQTLYQQVVPMDEQQYYEESRTPNNIDEEMSETPNDVSVVATPSPYQQ